MTVPANNRVLVVLSRIKNRKGLSATKGGGPTLVIPMPMVVTAAAVVPSSFT